MELDGYKWRTLISQVRLGKDEYRVIRPARRISHGSLSESWHGAELDLDEAAARELAVAWWLASRSPRSLVYLPYRTSRTTCERDCDCRSLDLVLLHHSLQFPLSRWKSVRARLGAGVPHTVKTPPNAFPVLGREDRLGYPGDLNQLRPGIAADTLFLVGSRHAFEVESDNVRDVAEDGPALIGEAPGRHYCAELGLGPTYVTYPNSGLPGGMLHVVLCEDPEVRTRQK
ncbi:hypothetical protein ACFQ05_36510 [Amycolatopsis umgeniensis]|uniref:Uncharacterized protein n=1 Tax=Amycolatopsis umgeniensis TaxID=336628 RepID=A0A841B9G6_9PSEU|nr:hypothetical protein [Amycolatopsis umgeniensis]MBB5855533.1 hypothetical protein [Amycolatopsis umgeniensis]